MQLLDLFANTTTLQTSYQKLMDNYQTVMSNSSGTTAPTATGTAPLIEGQLFYDTDATPNKWKSYNGTTWDDFNATTLNAKAGTEYMASIVGSALADCNNITLDAAWYYCATGTTLNIPVAVNGMLAVLDFPTNKQHIYITNDAIGSIYTRRYNGTTWDAWVITWNASNAGATSGLDADKLDGQHGAYYLPTASYTAADVLAKLITVDGATSGLDAQYLAGVALANIARTDILETFDAGLAVTGNISVTGTVDGIDVAAEKSRLAATSGVNTGDETQASINTLNVDADTVDGVHLAEPQLCKAWVNFEGTLAAASMIQASYNVSSITDNGVGDYTVNFATAMGNVDYCTVTDTKNSLFAISAGTSLYNNINIASQLTSGVRLDAYSYTGSTNTAIRQDMVICNVQIFGN